MPDIRQQAEQWLRSHPSATPLEAFIAGYLHECDNWLFKRK